MITDKKEAIMTKVKALMAKTTENGCSEAEAMTAMEKVTQLMHDYNISDEDLDSVHSIVYGLNTKKAGKQGRKQRSFHPTRDCWYNIGILCNCKTWVQGIDLIFFGAKEDTDTAHYFCMLLKATSEKELADYKLKADRRVHGLSQRASFMRGFTERVNEKMKDMIKEKNVFTESKSKGSDVMVLKGQVVERKYESYLKSKGIKMRTTSTYRSGRDGASYRAGQSAGSGVTFGRSSHTLQRGAKQLN